VIGYLFVGLSNEFSSVSSYPFDSEYGPSLYMPPSYNAPTSYHAEPSLSYNAPSSKYKVPIAPYEDSTTSHKAPTITFKDVPLTYTAPAFSKHVPSSSYVPPTYQSFSYEAPVYKPTNNYENSPLYTSDDQVSAIQILISLGSCLFF
jgi:hypothetical protein